MTQSREANVARFFLVLSVGVLVTACSATPIVTKQRMALGEANVENMECRREAPGGSSIPRTVCTSPETWKRYDKAQADKSAAFFDRVAENPDNRVLTGMRHEN
jgi:hypothetical protein